MSGAQSRWALAAGCLWVAAGCAGGDDAETGPGAGDSVAVDSLERVDSVGGLAGDEKEAPDSLAGGLVAEDSLWLDSLVRELLAGDLLAGGSVAVDSLAAVGDSSGPGDAVLPRPTVLLPVGTQLNLIALEEISTDGFRVGDAVVAALADDVTDPDGTVVVAAGTLFLGRLTASAGSGGIGEEPVLEMTFETLSATDYERPIETLVIDAPVALDAEAERARSAASGADRLVEVAGRIAAGSVIAVQIRESVRLPAPLPDSLLAGDSAAVADTIPSLR